MGSCLDENTHENANIQEPILYSELLKKKNASHGLITHMHTCADLHLKSNKNVDNNIYNIYLYVYIKRSNECYDTLRGALNISFRISSQRVV